VRNQRRASLGKPLFCGWIALSLSSLLAQTRSVTEDLPVEETQKNIRVLDGLPTSQLIPVMAVMANSLGVTCAYCHTSEWGSDEKAPKEVARRMIRMTLDTNRVFYEAKTVVTCNTCHRGALQPVGIPRIADAGWNRRPSASPEVKPLPSLGDVVERYVSYVGGRERVRRVRARRLAGVVTRDSGRATASGEFRIEQEKPNRFQTKTDLSYPAEANRWIASLFFLDFDSPEVRSRMNVIGRSQVDGEETVVVELRGIDGRLHRLDFDARRGFLRRISDELPTLIGPLTEEYVLHDYREVNRVRLPFTMEWSRGDYHVVHRLTRVELLFSK
jgi:hypothetical protein